LNFKSCSISSHVLRSEDEKAVATGKDEVAWKLSSEEEDLQDEDHLTSYQIQTTDVANVVPAADNPGEIGNEPEKVPTPDAPETPEGIPDNPDALPSVEASAEAEDSSSSSSSEEDSFSYSSSSSEEYYVHKK
jgi:hypothetical protein